MLYDVYFKDEKGNKSILFGDMESAELFAKGAKVYYQDCK